MPSLATGARVPFADPASGLRRMARSLCRLVAGSAVALGCMACALAATDWIWIEGEQPIEAKVTRHPGWYDQVPKAAFSGGDFLSHFHDTDPGEAEYRFTVAAADGYDFWIRANPHESELQYRLNGGDWHALVTTNSIQSFTLNGWDMRFLGWIHGGRVDLTAGENRIRFRFSGRPKPHGILDCFVLTRGAFEPFGIEKPDTAEAARRAQGAAVADWFPFQTKPGGEGESAIDLRFLNEQFAGENGRILARGGHFVHERSGEPVRFWAVNGPPHELEGEALKTAARRLACYGVNLVRVHGAVFDEKTGELQPAKVDHLVRVLEAMKAEGIYTHLSIYFPLWFKPQPGLHWLEGYDGNKHPFAALLFNEGFQRRWEQWWRAVLTARTSAGRSLVEDPALFGVEIQNEDSFFFWTFSEANLPKPQWELLRRQFAAWLAAKYGSLAAAFTAWSDGKGAPPADGLPGFPPLWQGGSRRNLQDRDAAQFLLETQMGFYRRAVAFFRSVGFPGLVTPSNWTTANQEVLGPLEKYSYTAGDFIDRHGYFGCRNSGLFSEWSIRDGHTYVDRSALRFDAEEPGGRPQFNHPAIDIKYDGKPSMISETTWTRPNRYRSEAPLYLAVYGALQDSDAIVHFAFDGAEWSVKPNFFMQPWTLMAPAQVGQFPAAALLFRQGLVRTGESMADVTLGLDELKQLRGTPLPQDAAFDELRLKDVPANASEVRPGQRIDPLVHFTGRTRVTFSDHAQPAKVKDLGRLIDRANRIVTSGTGEVKLDYGRGLLTIDAPSAQGASGNLGVAGTIRLRDLAIQSPLDNVHILAVSLDRQPIASARRVLLQVMSEERTTGWKTTPQGRLQLIESIGRDPWQVRRLAGSIQFLGTSGGGWTVTGLDLDGRPRRELSRGNRFDLQPDVIYYLLTR